MSKAQILIVEDDGIVAKDIKNSLKKLGFSVSAVVSYGEEAVEKAKADKPDLVLMDIMLKGDMNGIGAAGEIRDQFNVPVVYLTAYADEDLLERAKITEPYGYIIKPFEDRELNTAIEMALYKHKMEKRLKESEQWLSTTLKSIGDAVIAVDNAGDVTFLNPVAESLTGWNAKEAIGRSLEDVFNIINEETRKPVENPVTKVIREGRIIGLANHTVLIAKDGTEILIGDSGSPIIDEKGDIVGAVLVSRDEREKRESEKALKEYSERLEERVEERTKELKEAHMELIRREKLSLLGQLAGGVSHELRNPLGGIKNGVYFLNMAIDNPEPEIKETLDILDREVANATKIIQSLFDCTDPNRPKLHLNVDINERVRENLSRINIPENIEVVTVLDESLSAISAADPDLMDQGFVACSMKWYG